MIFTSQRTAGDGEAYEEAARRMSALAASAPGYLGHRSVRDKDGLGITVSYWRTQADADAFRQVADHRAVQRQAFRPEGRAAWYNWYVSETAVVERVRTGQSAGPNAPSVSSRASMPASSADQ